MKIKNMLAATAVCAIIGLAAGCGKKDTAAPADATNAPTESATVEQPFVNPEVFNRAMARAAAQVQAGNYSEARRTLQEFDNLKFTPQQQQALDALKARIPEN